MRKRLGKQIISLVLSVIMIGMTAVPAGAQEIVPENEQLKGNLAFTEMTGNPLETGFDYDVTEEEVAAFEAAYESQLRGDSVYPLGTEEETLEEFAEKKALVLTALYGLTSVQYALIEDGEITLSGTNGYTDKAAKTEADGSTMYGIGSISKIFTTMAVLQLAEDGKLSLDEPVVSYIPEFKMADARYKDITVRMLLNHSSGILGSSFENAILFNDNDTINHDTFLKLLETQRLKADPGAFSVYCNDGFTLAEILVERVSGQTFSEYIEENIRVPLGMWGTKTPQDKFKKKKLAGIYSGTQKLPAENFNQIGTGGIYSTAENLCYLAEVFMKDSEWDNVLAKESVAMTMGLSEPKEGWSALQNKKFGYGLGWDDVNTYPFNQYGVKALVKGGDSIYCHGSLIVLPEAKKAVAVLSSGGSSTVDQIFGSAILLRALQKDGIIDDVTNYVKAYEKPVKQTIPTDMKQYEGYYNTLQDIQKVEMTNDGTMKLTSLGTKQSAVLMYTGNGKFRTISGNAEYWFVKEGNGEVYLRQGSYAALAGIGDYFVEAYAAQKIENNPLDEEAAEAWNQRKGKRYFLINEKYSSVNYFSGGMVSTVDFLEELEGYLGNAKIVDENKATTDLQIPEQMGRELRDYEFYTQKGVEYIKMNNYLLISEDGVDKLPVKKNYEISIDKNGYAEWYYVNKKAAKRVMKVAVPGNGSFTVYDKDGKCQLCSYVTGETKIKLPKGGYVVFAGDAGAEFVVKVKNKK